MVNECNFTGCKKEQTSRGLCSGHYQQLRAGKTLTQLRVVQRLHVDENGRVCTACGHYKVWSDYYAHTTAKRSRCRQCQIAANTITNRKRLYGQAEPIARARQHKDVN